MRTLKPLADVPGFPEAFANEVAKNARKVCGTCGLAQMGHGPESGWLGYESHAFAPVPATPAMLARANDLTTQAYRARRSERCGHRFPQYPRCSNPATCPHTDGHCKRCAR